MELRVNSLKGREESEAPPVVSNAGGAKRQQLYTAVTAYGNTPIVMQVGYWDVWYTLCVAF